MGQRCHQKSGGACWCAHTRVLSCKTEVQILVFTDIFEVLNILIFKWSLELGASEH